MIPGIVHEKRMLKPNESFLLGTTLGTSQFDGDLHKLDIDFLQSTLPLVGIDLDSQELKRVKRACLTRDPNEIDKVKEFAQSLQKQVESVIASEPDLATMYRLGIEFHIMHHIVYGQVATSYQQVSKEEMELMKTLVSHITEQVCLAKELLCIELDSPEVTQ